jgi:hypothetical protein
VNIIFIIFKDRDLLISIWVPRTHEMLRDSGVASMPAPCSLLAVKEVRFRLSFQLEQHF